MNLLIVTAFLLWILWLLRRYDKRNSIYIDDRGYERDGYGTLVHRKVAYNQLYNGNYSEGFGSYDVHHIDRNKRNNSPENLQILTREEHKAEHGV